MTANYSVERDVRMAAGDQVTIGPYEFNFAGVKQHQGANYDSTMGMVRVERDGKVIASLTPEKRNYFVRGMVMTEAAIDAGVTRDLYVALGEPLEDGSWAVRIYYKPFMRWVWGGGLIMAIGGFVALSDRRYRLKLQAKVGVDSSAATTGGRS